MKCRAILSLCMAAVLLVMVFAGCSTTAGSGQSSSSAGEAAAKPQSADADNNTGESGEKKYIIGMSIDTTNQAWRAGLVRDVTEEAAKHPEIELVITDAQGNGSKQISDVEDLITRKVDAILISPYEGQTLTPICAQAYQEGIPVLVLDRELNGDQFTTFIGANNRAIGEEVGVYVEKYMRENGKTKLVEIQGLPGSSTCIDRSEPVIDAVSKNPDIKIVTQQAANWDENEAMKVTENILQAYQPGEIDVIYVHCDPMALGVLKAMRSAERMEIDIISIDGQKQALEAIQKGEIVTTFTYPFPGAEGVRTALKILSGETVDRVIDIPSVQIDKANVEKYYDPDAAF